MPRVWFAGWHADPSPWFPAFDVFAMPSRWEGLPLVAIEAMYASLPIVASDVDGSPRRSPAVKLGSSSPLRIRRRSRAPSAS